MKRILSILFFLCILMPAMAERAADIPLRVLNHWDNLDGTVERGYAGKSIFFRNGKVSFDSLRIKQYAEINKSIGINGTVLNNVNASPKMMIPEILDGVKDIADILRRYGIKVYLSVNFASPKVVGGLSTADPLDTCVAQWWKDKVAEIYARIPDFGGFLVKANSEGQPGPGDYHRTHAEGANMLADALQPYGGIVMWRAFVYAANSPDRASQAYDEFLPLDGQFHDNVILQIKNGPIDFQPREPVSPLFFAMKKTRMMPEFQITQEYTGESIHTCFLASMWKEFFDATKGIKFDGIAGVANIGDNEIPCGSFTAIANWIAFGGMAKNTKLSPASIARDVAYKMFLKPSKSEEREQALKSLTQLLLESHEAVVSYMMPMGLHHIFAGGHHYGPEPWCYHEGWREDWLPRYYHKADATGLGFNRTATGSNNIAQYPEHLQSYYSSLSASNPYLLWFNHIAWKQKLDNGKTMWETLCRKYDEGVRMAESFVETWKSAQPYIRKEIYEDQLKRFERQAKDAWWWRDACLLYFQQFSKMKLPKGSPAPRHNLDDLMRYHLDMDNYTAANPELLP